MQSLHKPFRKPLLACALAAAVVAVVAFAVWPREPRYDGKPLSYWLDQLPVTVVSPHDHSSILRPSQYEVATFATMVWYPQPRPITVWSNGRVVAVRTSSLAAPSLPVGGVGSPLSAIADRAVVDVGPRALPTLLNRLRTREHHLTPAEKTVLEWRLRLLSLVSTVQPSLPPWLEVQIKRGQAVTALLRLGDAAKPILPQVNALARSDPDPGVRVSALEVLRRLSPGDYAQVLGQTNVISAAAR